MARSTGLLQILGVAVALVACNATQTPLGEEPVDQSYQVRYLDGRKNADPYQGLVFVRATGLLGKLHVCGAFVGDMSDARFAEYGESLHDMQSYLRFGADDQRRPVVRPGFLAVTRTRILTGGDGRPQLPSGIAANCVGTEIDWDDSYGRLLFTLELRETRLKPLFRPYP